MTGTSPELLLCDTSFVGRVDERQTNAERVAHWDGAVLDRIARARLAVSVVTIAETRGGFAIGGYGQPRVRREEQRLLVFGRFSITDDVVGEWVRLRTISKREGLNVGANDLWIAATAEAIEAPLVSCDADHERLAHHLAELIYLPVAPPDAS